MSEKTFYSTVDEVIAYSGAVPEKLGLETQTQLKQMIEKWLKQITCFINADRNRDYLDETTLPEGIENIAMRMCANLIRGAERQRSGSVIQLDSSQMVIDDPGIFTKEIKEDLRRFPRKPRFSMAITPGEDENDNA